jgi:hypothetical protein
MPNMCPIGKATRFANRDTRGFAMTTYTVPDSPADPEAAGGPSTCLGACVGCWVEAEELHCGRLAL